MGTATAAMQPTRNAPLNARALLCVLLGCRRRKRWNGSERLRRGTCRESRTCLNVSALPCCLFPRPSSRACCPLAFGADHPPPAPPRSEGHRFIAGAIRDRPIQANGRLGNDRKEMRPGGHLTTQTASFRELGLNLDPITADHAQETISNFLQLFEADKNMFWKVFQQKCHHMSCYAPAMKYMDGMCIDMSETSRYRQFSL